MIHEFEKKIDNSGNRLPRESISFLKQSAGELRSGQMLNWKDEMMKQEQYKDHRNSWQGMIRRIRNSRTKGWQEV